MTVKEAEAVFGKRAKNEHELRRITSERARTPFGIQKFKAEVGTTDRRQRGTAHGTCSHLVGGGCDMGGTVRWLALVALAERVVMATT